MRLPSDRRHFEVGANEAQPLVDFTVQRVLACDEDVRHVSIEYVDGFCARVPAAWLTMEGHALEAAITNSFPYLRRYARQLKRQVVERAVRDAPGCAPREVLDLFSLVLAE